MENLENLRKKQAEITKKMQVAARFGNYEILAYLENDLARIDSEIMRKLEAN